MPCWLIRTKPRRLIASFDCKRKQGGLNWRKKPERAEHNGKLSPNANRKLKQAIRWLSAAATEKEVYEKKQKRKVKYKVALATLTFKENMQDDNKARKILSQWLEMAKHRFELFNYVWKAEPQERGAIHFHLILPIYIPYKELRYTWNRLLKKHGLEQDNANSTDIHAVTNAKNLEAYLAAYMTNEDKHEGRRPIKGRLWGCSQALTKAGREFLLIDKDELTAMTAELHEYSLEHKLMKEGKEIPEFLKYNGLWIVPDDYFDKLPKCELKDLYFKQIEEINTRQKRQYFPILELN